MDHRKEGERGRGGRQGVQEGVHDEYRRGAHQLVDTDAASAVAYPRGGRAFGFAHP